MLEIVRAASLVELARRCGSMLAGPPDDPLAPEWIATPTPGIGRWLALELARTLGASSPDVDDGITANVVFARGGALRRAVLDAGLAAERRQESWDLDHVVWVLCALRDADAAGLGLPPLAAGAATTGWARRTAGLLARYDLDRPGMLRAWAAGADTGSDGRRLPDVDRWQPRLFRALRDRLGVPCPAERLPELYAELAAGSLPLELPDRLAYFGFTVPPGASDFVDLIRAVAVHRDVHGYFCDPSPTTDAGGWTGLLGSWGRPAADARVVLAGVDDRVEAVPAGTVGPAGTVLHRLQERLGGATDHLPADSPALDGSDASIRVHGAQGTRRQVEVLRDAILGALAADPGLCEDDILVCCSDLDRFVPLIQTIFGGVDGPAGTGHASRTLPAGTPTLRYRVDDGRGRPGNPVVVAVRRALELATGRFGSLDIVEFCGLEAVRRRWGFDDVAVNRIRQWVTDLDVRWGFDPAQRSAQGVPTTLQAGTWQRALDRLSVGVAFARDDLIVGDDLVPVGVEGEDIEVLGGLVGVLTRLMRIADTSADRVPVSERLRGLAVALGDLVAPPDGAEWQLDAVARMCRLDPSGAGLVTEVTDELTTTLGDLLPELFDRLESGGARSNAFRGGVTITSPQALTGVPFRIVCLLGLDDDSIPGGVGDGDDLCRRDPRPGDRDGRAATLHGFLSSIQSTRDQLLVFHDHRDLATNDELADGVVLAALCAEIDASSAPAGLVESSYRVTHPRHGTDPSCFRTGGIVPDRTWSFDTHALTGAMARSGGSGDRHESSVSPASSPPTYDESTVAATTIDLSDLCGFAADPAAFLCRHVLGVRFTGSESDLESHLRTALDGLELHAIRQELLDRCLDDPDGDPIAVTEPLLTASDRLPVGVLGSVAFEELAAEAIGLADAARAVRADAPAQTVAIDWTLPDGRRLVGEVSVRPTPTGFQTFDAGAGRSKVGRRIRAWVESLALAVTRPEADVEAVLVRRAAKKSKDTYPPETFVIGLPSASTSGATEALTQLIDWFEAWGRCPGAVSFEAFGRHLLAGNGEAWPDGAADQTSVSEWDRALRYSEPLRFLAAETTLDELLAEPAVAGDPGPVDVESRLRRFMTFIDDAWAATVDANTTGVR